MILSVLIPTISSRASTLSRSLWYLQQQDWNDLFPESSDCVALVNDHFERLREQVVPILLLQIPEGP